MTVGQLEISRRSVLKTAGVCLGTGLFASPVAANSEVRVFAHPRRGRDVGRAVELRGGTHRVYDNFDFVAARMPAKALDALRRDDRVGGVELDGVIRALPVRRERTPSEQTNETWSPDGWTDGTWSSDEWVNETLSSEGWANDTSTHEELLDETTRRARRFNDDPTLDGPADENQALGGRSSQTSSWGHIDIAADSAHALGVTGEGVDIAVLDTGTDTGHDDLRVVGGRDCTSWWPWSTDYDDRNGHGTHCAGIATARDNGNGVVGVAPRANLYAVKVLGDNGSGYWSDAIQGIDWCLSNRIPIISMSLGGDSIPSALRDSLKRAADEGHLVVAAAGNNGNDGDGDCDERNIDAPARNRHVLAVGASDADGDVARFSSVGRKTELTAPGANIYSTYEGNSYATLSGTSMATPHVAGAAALVWQAAGYGAPSGNEGARVRDVLTSTATVLDGTCDEGYGMVNAYEAVRAVR
jgi:minor extracellular protease Epr